MVLASCRARDARVAFVGILTRERRSRVQPDEIKRLATLRGECRIERRRIGTRWMSELRIVNIEPSGEDHAVRVVEGARRDMRIRCVKGLQRRQPKRIRFHQQEHVRLLTLEHDQRAGVFPIVL